jgi:tRNA(fMet)-specific endonuclease VapC
MERLETSRVCVDTDIIIDYLRGRNENQEILPALIGKYEVYISPVSIYELYYGGYYSGKLKPVEDVLAILIPFDWTPEDSKKSAQIHVTLTKAGKTSNIKDILVAGPCLTRNIPLITRNILHFRKIKGLKVIEGTTFLKNNS